MRRALAVLVLAGALGCAHGRGGSGALKVVCNVPQATLRIDDVFMGRVSEWATARPLGAGFHRLEIAEPEHFTFYAEIRLKAGQGTEVRAELRPQLE
jgi:hypothetical protein